MEDVIVRVHNVYKRFVSKNKTINALRDVSLNIYSGEILALLGVNGAGKTTLSSIVATLHPPTSGDVLYKGNSIYKNLMDFRRVISFCPQKPNFEKLLSVKENLIFAGRYYGLDKKDIEQRAIELMKEFELDQYAESSPNILSGGYKQRLLIARALMHDPELIILDEPTVGMDAPIRRQLWALIRRLKKKGVTTILTTHYFDEADKLADRICILDKGEIILEDTPKNLRQAHENKSLEDIFVELIEERQKLAVRG
jgi:ABC-2 type transport system ATP-binding protein